MAWLKLNPITKRRFARFKAIRRGYYSLIILLVATILSIFAPYIAESRALMVYYHGSLYFPTFEYLDMATFHQTPPPGWNPDIETNYLKLKHKWQVERYYYNRARAKAGSNPHALTRLAAEYPDRNSYVIMPLIPWNPYQSDFWNDEVLHDIQALLDKHDRAGAESLARQDQLGVLANAIHSGAVAKLLANPKKSPTGTLLGLARTGAMPSLAGLGEIPPTAPSMRREHYLGTDEQGRDVATRLLYGFRISIFFAIFLVFTGQLIGTVIGSLQGYLGGRFDIFSQRIIEILISIPFLYVVIILASLVTPTFWMLVVVMALFQWIPITFYMRTEMYREKTKEYCLAAKSYGASNTRIVFRHLLPNCLTPLVTFSPFAMVTAIFSLTALDYLGYGLPAPTPSWGELINQALQVANRDKLWLILAPFGALTFTLVLVVFIGESAREAFDPKRYARYE